jgi:aspartyl-tRNA(Asn)/glutamyl-tRNA(Gln) amidotransferase subunit C
MLKLSPEQVKHIAALARLHLKENDIETFQVQLSNIMENFSVLEKLDTSSILPTRQPNSISNVMRPDFVIPSMPTSDVLANAPHQEDQCIKIKAVLED